jgi:hypothetical protein
MPYLIRLPAHGDADDLSPSLVIKQAQLYLFRMLREQRKVHTLSIPRSTQRIRTAWPNTEVAGRKLIHVADVSDILF